MAPWLILLVGAIYLLTAFDYFLQDRAGMMMVFLGYALANLGLFIDVK